MNAALTRLLFHPNMLQTNVFAGFESFSKLALHICKSNHNVPSYQLYQSQKLQTYRSVLIKYNMICDV